MPQVVPFPHGRERNNLQVMKRKLCIRNRETVGRDQGYEGKALCEK